MIPIFTTQYSGKSLLTLETVEKAKKNNKQSVFKICAEHGIENPVVVDSKMTGIAELFQNAAIEGISPRFGLNYKFLHSSSEETFNWHKIILFIKNTKGYKDLIRIHNTANVTNNGFISNEILANHWTENLKLVIPFYDSYIFKNTMYEGVRCMPEFEGIEHSFFVEDNGLPFDDLIASKITGDKVNVKSIYYEETKDFKTWQTYRCALNFSNKGKNRTLESPMFDHCHSDEFSFESYLEKVKSNK